MRRSGNSQIHNRARLLALRTVSSLSIAIALCVVAVPAYAQSGSNAGQASEPKTNETEADALIADIVVTARKRNETASNTPVAISAFGGAQLEALHVRDLRDLNTSLPNVRFEPAASPGVANFTVRGLGINSSIPTIDPTVGTFVDGVYVGTSYGVVLDSFDLEAIEVLRGPQGLLFGRNVTGGAVLLRSRRPKVGGDFGGRAKFSVETGAQYTAAASIEIPLGSRVAGKVTGYYTNDAGYFTNSFDGKKVGKQEMYFVRPTLVAQLTDTLDSTLIVEHGKATGDGTILQNPQFYSGFTINIDRPGSLDLKWTQVTSETNLDVSLGNGKITNIFGYRTVKHIAFGDFDGRPLNLFHAIFALDQKQYSDELRYHGTFFDDKLDVTTGLYFFTQDILYRERRFIRGGAVDVSFGGNQQQDTFGLFGALDYSLTPRLKLTLGARYTIEDKKAQVATFSAAAPRCMPLDINFTATACTFNFDGSASFSNLSPKIGLTWKPNDDSLIYASATRGFRSGGFNVRNTSTAASSGPTDDEAADAYELGGKFALFDRHLRINAALFLNKIDNLQRETNVADPVVGVIQAFRNTANARIAGIEVDGVAKLSNRFSIDFAGGYQDGKYLKILIDLNGDRVINQADFDLKLPRLANISASVGANYELPLPGAGGALTFRAQYAYQDGAAFTDSNSSFLRSADFVNASVKFATDDDRLSFSVYGKNLLNSVYESTNAPTPFGGFRSLAKGRVFGADIAVKF
jgi:iron complex outermembrane recepter protein